jgi:hypothetical protein
MWYGVPVSYTVAYIFCNRLGFTFGLHTPTGRQTHHIRRACIFPIITAKKTTAGWGSGFCS